MLNLLSWSISDSDRRELVELLMEVPATNTKDGRTALLLGLEKVHVRRSENKIVDLGFIVEDLSLLIRSDNTPCLVVLIDNALQHIKGMSLGEDLKQKRQELIRHYNYMLHIQVFELMRFDLDELEKKFASIVPQTPQLKVSGASPGVAPDLAARVREQLALCGPFASEGTLKAVFIDNRISPWRNDIPEGDSVKERVEMVMAFLFNQANSTGQNGLVLFLRVLSERNKPGDACGDTLAALAAELEQSLTRS